MPPRRPRPRLRPRRRPKAKAAAPVAAPAAKASPKVAAKAPVKAPAKAVAKAPAKVTAKAAAKAEEKPADKSTDKAAKKKVKLMRDSFTMPENEYAQIAVLKKRLLAKGVAVKKSELLRCGFALLAALSDEDLVQAMAQVAKIKTGRPAKSAR